jgi:hypothetical protein
MVKGEEERRRGRKEMRRGKCEGRREDGGGGRVGSEGFSQGKELPVSCFLTTTVVNHSGSANQNLKINFPK